MARIPRDGLTYLSLGGAGEIGMNLSLYGHEGKWLMVDLGMTFADETQPGIDILVPDPAWIADRAEDLIALVVTHAHEDHLGAIAYLWEQLRCPVYATPFAATVLRRKLEEWHLLEEVPLHIYHPGDRFTLGPFDIEAIPLTHSIPEMQALAIRTKVGMVLHTGDWKLDPDPVVGMVSDEAALRRIGDEGVLAMVCDSTNVFKYGESGSEALVRDELIQICKERKKRIAITTFASNIARIQTVSAVAKATGRDLCLVGRSLWNMANAARDNGYLKDVPEFRTEYDFGYLPPERTLLMCTGCQGEPRGAMARIASGTHPQVELSRGDTVIFSSRMIPGNERTIGKLQNDLTLAGVDVITEKDGFVHVSGHPARDELARMYSLVRPRISVPVHGEARHIAEHAKLAKSLQVPYAIEVQNGDLILLEPRGARLLEKVPAGRLAVDQGNGDLLLLQGEVMQSRRRMTHNGAVFVSLVLDARGGFAAEPAVTLLGVADDEKGELAADIADAIAEAFERPKGKLSEDEVAVETARKATRRVVKDYCGRRPPVEVHIARTATAAARVRPGKVSVP